jgi:L-2-hydroxyglutarate oxidase LhgO
LVNAAGLYADHIAALAGVPKYQIHPCRGDYYVLKSGRSFRHLIYPVKKKNAPGLGIHLTLDLAGRFRLGPDTTWIDKRDDYNSRGDRAAEFAAAASKILGPIRADEISYESSGIRPKLRSRTDAEEKDFVIAQDAPGLINLVGIESPGLTACLAIAEEAQRLASTSV